MGVMDGVVARVGHMLRPIHAGDDKLARHRLHPATAPSLEVTSPAFLQGSPIPRPYTKDGADMSPPLVIGNVPPSAQELVLICEDPDAPAPKPFLHWLAYGLSPQTAQLPEGVAKTSHLAELHVHQGTNGFRTYGYGGPSPPRGHGVHHYHFQVFALDSPLLLSSSPSREEVLRAMSDHVVAHGSLVGTYERT